MADSRPYRNKKELVDECVEVHLALADSCVQQARGRAAGFDGLSNDQAVQAARLAWSAMQRARLFCFEPDRWITAYNAADRYTTETLAGLDWRPQRRAVRRDINEIRIDNRLMWDMTSKEALDHGYLERVPGRNDGAAAITQAGWEAFRELLAKREPARKERFQKVLQVAQEASRRGDREMMLAAITQIEDALYEEAPEDSEKMVTAYEDHGVRWPFPDPLPFDSCFFCFGRRLNLAYSPTALHTRVRPADLAKLGVRSIYLLGYLLAWEGDVPFVFTALQFGDGDGTKGLGGGGDVSVVGLVRTYEDSEWAQPMSLDPWILTMLVKAVNDHKQIVEGHTPTLSTRMARKQLSKGHKQLLPLPSPFYMVNLKDELIVNPETAHRKTSGRPVEWSHRWDVRGHECVRIERGELPVDPKEVARLKKRGYRIYEGMSLTAEDAQRLLKRNVRAPGPREWIAVLSYWRDATIKGPEDKPYIPAARTEPELRQRA